MDGRIENCFTEDVPRRFEAASWNVIVLTTLDALPAEQQVSLITVALQQAKLHRGQPTLVVIDTVIGFGSRKANTG